MAARCRVDDIDRFVHRYTALRRGSAASSAV
jgi:hypothetical protein